MIKAANNPFGIKESGDNLKSLESITTDNNKIVALVNDSSSAILRDDSKALIRSVSEKNLFPKKDSYLENLPSDWKGFDFSRKKSCILSSTNYQCVTKAINHLESLQITIEKWMKIEDKSGDISSPIRRLVSPQTDESVVNVDGELTNVETGVNLIVVSEEAPVEDLRVGGVLSEVLNLILRLEKQRHRANSLLLNERFILNRLKIDIEALALKKVRDLPAKVQIEHDACLADITELNWHISFNQKTESKLQKRCDIAERIHDRLKERVTNIKEMTPQIEEKCNQERELRKRIEKTQKDIDEMLAKTKDRLKDTQERADAANLKAAREREAYEAELNAARWELNKARKRLQEAVEVKNSNQKTYEEWTEKIKSNEKEEKEELKKKTEFKSINEKLKEQLQVLNQERYRVQKELDRARAENEAKQMNIDQLKLGFDTEIGKLTETLNKKTEKLEKILKKKLEKEVNIEEMDNDKKNMESKLEKDQRTRDRLLEEKTRVEDEMRSTEINYDMCMREHKNVLIEHDKELKRLAYKEDVLRRQILELQKQIAEERYSINSIIARMSSENAEYERNKKLLEQRKSQYAVRKRDLDSALVELRKRVANKEKLKTDTENQVAKLKSDLKDIAERQPREEEELSQKTLAESNRLESSLVRLKTDSDRLEYMKSHMEKMNKNMDEMTTGKENMLKNISKLNNDIQDLEVVKTEQTTRCMSSKRLYEQVKTNLDETNYRLVAKTADHTELLEERRNFLDGLLKTLGNTLAINKELASRYRSLKYASFNVKLALIQKFEIKLNRHLSVSDKRQMNALQARMHEALNDFFNFKMRQAEMDYKKLDDTRHNLGETIEKIEENFRESINEVSEFLDEQNSIDYDKMRQQAMQKVHKEELIAAQKQQQQQKQQQNEQQPNSVNLKINKKVYINVN